jgi:hypothetical protein
MWNISSNDVEHAKESIKLRRAEVETRYAEEKEALDAEFAAIETLERAASNLRSITTGNRSKLCRRLQRRPRLR